jgi:ADP-ribosyltransferase exoenzyme
LNYFYGGIASFRHDYPVVSGLIPVFGSVMAAGDAFITMCEGKNADGQTVNRGWSLGVLSVNVALATLDAFMVKAAAIETMQVARSSASQIVERLKPIRARLAKGEALAAEEVTQIQKDIDQCLKSASGADHLQEIGKYESSLSSISTMEVEKRLHGFDVKNLDKVYTNGELESLRKYLGSEVWGYGDPKLFDQLTNADLLRGLEDLGIPRVKYQEINGYLRGTWKPAVDDFDRMNLIVKNIDGAIEKSKLLESVDVYRLNTKAYATPGADGYVAVNNAAPISTELEPQMQFVTGQKSDFVLQKFKLNPGDKAFYMESLLDFYGDAKDFVQKMPALPGKPGFGRQELLLPRNMRQRVINQYFDSQLGIDVQIIELSQDVGRNIPK